MINRKKIYNPNSQESVNERKIFGGNPTSIFELNKIKYQWAYNLWKVMLANSWFPEEVNMTQDKRDYADGLTPEEKIGYDRALAQLIFMDSLQTNNLIDNVNPYITSPEINLILVRQAFEEALHCLIEGTEVLTDRGFVDFRDLTYNDKVANYHENGEITFSNPKEIIKNKYNGVMYDFKMTNYHQVVTPNHRMVMKNTTYKRISENNRNKLLIKLAEETSLRNYNLPISGKGIGKVNNLTLLEKLAIVYQADGSKVNKDELTINGYCYKFSFKKNRKIDRFKSYLNKTKILKNSGVKKYTITKNDNYTHFYVWVDKKFDKEFDWVTLVDKSESYALEFLDELSYWDGCIRNKNSFCYTNSNKKAIDKVIALTVLANSQVGIHYVDHKKNKGNNKIDVWQLHIVLKKNYKTGRKIKKALFNYNGNVYCCTVDTGMIVCKYDNSIFITGNSQSYAVMVESISANTDEIYEMWRTDMQLRNKNDYIANVYEELALNPTESTLLKAMFANQILEGIYFYSGFAFFYTLARSGKMLGSAQMIRFIQRDEVTHLLLFQQNRLTINN